MNEEILIRFLIHRCTSEEIKVVDQWIASDQANADWLFEMERIWSLKDQLRFSDKQEGLCTFYVWIAGKGSKSGNKPETSCLYFMDEICCSNCADRIIKY